MIRRLFVALPLLAIAADAPLQAQEIAPRADGSPVIQVRANTTPSTDPLRSAIEGVVKQYLTTNPDVMDSIIKGYLMEHPEVILQSVASAQQRQQLVQAEQAKQALVTYRDKLFADPLAPIAGNPVGDLVLVEFFDYQCGYCKAVHPDVLKLVETEKRARIVLKEFPILGPASVIASKAALAARAQGKYEPLHNALMVHREQLDEATVFKLAASVGLDTEVLKRDMESPVVLRIIAENQALAASLGIRGTPAFLTPNRMSPGAIKLDEMKRMLAEQG